MFRQLLKFQTKRTEIPRRFCESQVVTVEYMKNQTHASQVENYALQHNTNATGQNTLHPLARVQNFEPVCPIVAPSFNIAAFVNKSEFLQQMVKLGVTICEWDKRPLIHPWILNKDYESQVKPIIQFLVDVGVQPDTLGRFFTKNPMLLNETLDDLEVRTNFLMSKEFNKEQIGRIFTRNPFWLLFKTAAIDSRLEFFLKCFQLSGVEVRQLATKEPRLITSKLDRVKEVNFGFAEEMGFEETQIKRLLLAKPKLWIMNRNILVNRFDYLHNVIKMDHETILAFPSVLTCRDFRIRQRHEFLHFLGRHQYDPTRPNYISPLDLIRGTDTHFAACVAKSSVLEFNDFCKTL